MGCCSPDGTCCDPSTGMGCDSAGG
jgi:hypothetical protein